MKTLSTDDADFADRFADLLAQGRATTQNVDAEVAAIIADVRARGDAALYDYTLKFDHFDARATGLRVTTAEIDQACAAIPADLYQALALAARRIDRFHRAQCPADLRLDDGTGIEMGMRWTAIDAAGLYVPGGKASYPSSVLMNAIPARIAGVARLAMAVPAPGGHINPSVLAAARLAGVSEIWRIGGAQAIAAFAYGTASIAAVDRITGPGNAYVAQAKQMVAGLVGIDSVAGPSEVVILADADNNPTHIAADLLAQAEHDESAQSILITDSADLARQVASHIAALIAPLPRAAIAQASLDRHGAIILVASIDEAITIIDRLAPEHVQIMLPDPQRVMARVRHAGAIFLGAHTPEALGDYIAGPNHVLPTARTARFASGLSVFDFLKRTTWIAATQAGLTEVAKEAALIADTEKLDAHALSLRLRL